VERAPTDPSPTAEQARVRPIEVTYFQRRRRAASNFSLEFIFEDVRRRLAGLVRPRVAVARFESSGVLRRAYLCLEALFRQSEVNHVTGDINFVGILLQRRRTIQTVLDCAYLARTRGVRRAILRLLWLDLPVRRCAYVTAISGATKAEILRNVPGCDPGKIVVIPVAISPGFRLVEKPFEAACPRILQIGTAPNKNLPRLIQALAGLSCQLDVIGRHNPEYQAQLEASGLAWSWRWDLPQEGIVRAYAEADLVAFVSTYEGFGMPILEAQATGRPVVTSNLLSMPEVAGEGACLVDPTDVGAIRAAIERIIQDADYRARLVRAGLENVRRYDPDAIARAYLELYRKVAGR
jgi:glycosyltransferase involved in cell wall biosynthesis